jgi:hypothetical protein
VRTSPLRLIAPAVGVSIACAALALVPAAGAASASGPLHHPGITFGHIGSTALASPAAARHGFNINGYNWSGAAATGSGFTSVSASWTEPSVTCNSTNDLMAPWVGIDGYGSNTVEQTGVATDCSSGHAVYQAWYEMYPKAPVYYTNSVSAGDKFNASVTRSGSTYTLSLTDTTKGWTRTTTKSLSSARNVSAEVIIESPTGAYPRFGTVSFSNAKINGSNLSNFNPVLMDASNSSGYEDHTSAVSGGSFSISYLHE